MENYQIQTELTQKEMFILQDLLINKEIVYSEMMKRADDSNNTESYTFYYKQLREISALYKKLGLNNL